MNDVSEEDVIAFVDGCLAGPALAAFEAKLSVDRGLAERVAAHRWMARQVVVAYGDPPGGEVDEVLVTRLGLADNNVSTPSGPIPSGSRRVPARRPSWALLASGALAASFFAGILIGTLRERPATSWLHADISGRIAAGGALAEGLSNSLSGQGGPIRVGISFRTTQGVCRTFRTSEGLSGLGCRRGGQWAVPIVVTGASGPDAETEYRLAGGNVAPAVMSEADRLMIGEPLTAAEEEALKGRGWE